MSTHLSTLTQNIAQSAAAAASRFVPTGKFSHKAVQYGCAAHTHTHANQPARSDRVDNSIRTCPSASLVSIWMGPRRCSHVTGSGQHEISPPKTCTNSRGWGTSWRRDSSQRLAVATSFSSWTTTPVRTNINLSAATNQQSNRTSDTRTSVGSANKFVLQVIINSSDQ